MLRVRHDVRDAWRALVRARSLSIGAVLALGLAVGPNLVVLSLAHAALVAPLPFTHGSRLVALWEYRPDAPDQRFPVAVENLLDWVDASPSIDKAATYQQIEYRVGTDDDLELVAASSITPEFFEVLGVEALAGRLAPSSADARVAAGDVVISEAFWRRRFGADRGIVGKTLPGEFRPPRVIRGVVPGPAVYPPGTDVWNFASQLMRRDGRTRNQRFHSAIARLRPGATVRDLREELDVIAGSLAQEHPDSNDGWTVGVESLRDEILGRHRQALVMITVAVGLVLAAALANVAAMLRTSLVERRGEMAVRAALGASRGDLLRVRVLETAILSALAVAVGFVLSTWLRSWLNRWVPETLTARLPDTVGWSYSTLAVTLWVVAVAALGLAAYVGHRSFAVSSALSTSSATTARSVTGRRHSTVAIVTQIAATFAVLAAAGVMMRSVWYLSRVDVGIRPERLFAFDLNLPTRSFMVNGRVSSSQSLLFYRELVDAVRTRRGVSAAAIVATPPLSGRVQSVQCRLPDNGNAVVEARRTVVTDSYFSTMGIALKDGRFLSNDDLPLSAVVLGRLPEDAERPVVVNQRMANWLAPGRQAVGEVFTIVPGLTAGRRIVMGVAADVRSGQVDVDPPMEFYELLEQPVAAPTLMVRVTDTAAGELLQLRQEIRRSHPNLVVSPARSMQEVIREGSGWRRLVAVLLAALASLGLAISLVGTWASVRRFVARETRDTGVRIALGGDPRRVVAAVVLGVLRLVSVGLIFGITCYLWATGLIGSAVFGVSALDSLALAVAIAIILTGAGLAAYWPARAILRTDPARLLRTE